MNFRVQKKILLISIIGFSGMSVSILFMSFNSFQGGIPLKNIIAGAAFWVCLALGIITQIILALSLKKDLRLLKPTKKRRIGLLCFAENKYAKAADLCLALSFIGLILTIFFSEVFGYFSFIILFLFVFSLSMHCILNGKIYYFLTHSL